VIIRLAELPELKRERDKGREGEREERRKRTIESTRRRAHHIGDHSGLVDPELGSFAILVTELGPPSLRHPLPKKKI
jgi:hypothetical protein